MAFKVSYRSSFERDFKKLKPLSQSFVLDIADRIQSQNLQGEKLKGNFQSFYKFPFGYKPEYRLIYKIYGCRIEKVGKPHCMFDDIEHTLKELMNCNGLIEFVLIKTREEMNNLYAQSKKYLRNLSR